MNPQTSILIFFVLCGVGIACALLAPSTWQGRILAWFGCLAAIALLVVGANALLAGAIFGRSMWVIPELGALTLNLDRISGLFLCVTGLVLIPASIFAGGELTRRGGGRAAASIFLGLYGSIALIFIAGDALLLLLAWEVMSILSYLLIVSDGRKENGGASAGYLLLAIGEAGTLAVAVGFLLLAHKAGSLDFAALRAGASSLSVGARWAVFLLSFFGFGVKAGLAPVNFWLPNAYTSAPRMFAPVLAGATLNLGLYGIFRVSADLMPASGIGFGLVALAVGTVTALLGILYATTENDLKTMLAHSSIENAGIVVAGFGAGMVFVAAGHRSLAAIAFVASLYHLMNHSFYKTLLFIGAATVENQTGTRDMDRLGGLIRWMPLTAAAFLAGTLSIAALPPFNGFVSEWLTLQTLLRSTELSSLEGKLVFALCGAGLALTAALAVTCFVKVFAMSFLGMRRLDESRPLVEAPASALIPMGLLAVLCLAFGVLPTYVIPALDLPLQPLLGASAAETLVPPFFDSNPDHKNLPAPFLADFHNLGAQVGESVMPGRGLVVLHRGGSENPVVFAMSTFYSLAVLIALLLTTYVIVRFILTRRRQLARSDRWDGGVRRLLPEMTYTATGFSNSVRVVFDAIFRPTTVEDTRETVSAHFRTAIRLQKERVHLVDAILLKPASSAAKWLARGLASMHHGRINAYAAYVLIALLVVLIIALI